MIAYAFDCVCIPTAAERASCGWNAAPSNRGRFFRSAQLLVEEDSITPASIRIQRKLRHRADFNPVHRTVEFFRSAALARIEQKKCQSRAARTILELGHEGSRDAVSASATVHNQLCYVAAMRLIRRPRRLKLNRACDAMRISRDENQR